jgi:hypothetical protein
MHLSFHMNITFAVVDVVVAAAVFVLGSYSSSYQRHLRIVGDIFFPKRMRIYDGPTNLTSTALRRMVVMRRSL